MIPSVVELEPAYVLESRPYKESSVIAKLLTLHFGIVSLLAKGIKSSNSATKSLLQTFCPVTVSWRGRSELKNLTAIEASPHKQGQSRSDLKGDHLYAGLYANELLVKLVPYGEQYGALFAFYNDLIGCFYDNKALAPCLRKFEWHLICELGYGLNMETDIDTGELIESDKRYCLAGVDGFVQTDIATPNAGLFKGEELLAIRDGNYACEAGVTAKKLFRYVIAHYLGGRPLKSRELYIRMREIKNAKSNQ
ncbi:MAG: DNA repair protein RecO [Gammaproteobacteria bacterium]|nr:MAG: DNA repair protein RecO [Gammaproteobacteria bacterium]